MMGHVIFYHFRCKNRPTVFLLSQSCDVPSRYHQSCRHLTSSTPHLTKWEVVIAHPQLSSLYSLWLQGHSCGQLSPGHYLVAITQAAAQATIPRQHTRVLNVIETFSFCCPWEVGSALAERMELGDGIQSCLLLATERFQLEMTSIQTVDGKS